MHVNSGVSIFVELVYVALCTRTMCIVYCIYANIITYMNVVYRLIVTTLSNITVNCIYMQYTLIGELLSAIGGYPSLVIPGGSHAPYFLQTSQLFIQVRLYYHACTMSVYDDVITVLYVLE